MRDYRGKRLDNGNWVTSGSFARMSDDGINWDYYIGACKPATHNFDGGGNILESKTMDECLFYMVDPKTVGECTGIMGDFIHGEPKPGDNILRSFIYEGDIVEPVLTDGTHGGFSWGRHVVVFDQGAFCLKDRRGVTTPMCNYSASVKFKVLGNIHDNPELLEVSA